MSHEIHRVIRFKRLGPFTLQLGFEDETTQVVDFRPVLTGDLYGPLAKPEVFDRVRLDEESRTLVWPNGAAFDPAILYAWPQLKGEMTRLVKAWAQVPAP